MKRKRSIWIPLFLALVLTSILAFVGISGFSCSWAKIESSALEKPSEDEGDIKETDNENKAYENNETKKSEYEDRLTYIETDINRLREENERTFEYYSEGINRISIFVTIFGLMIAVFVPIIVFSLGYFFKKESEETLKNIVKRAEDNAITALDRAESLEKHINETVGILQENYETLVNVVGPLLPSIVEMYNTGLETVSADIRENLRRSDIVIVFAVAYLARLFLKGYITDDSTLINLSKLLFNEGFYKEATSITLELIKQERDPEKRDAFKYDLVFSYLKTGDYDKGIERLSELVRSNPSELMYRFTRAKAYYGSEDVSLINEIIQDLRFVFEAESEYVDRVLSTNEFRGISKTREFQQLIEDYPRDA